MSRLLRILPLLFVLASASAQNYKAGKLIFKNPGPYDQAALETAVGLHTGSSFTKEGLQKANQALMDTGLFDDAQATLDGNISSVSVIFTLKPGDAAQLLPARFDNFPWWSPEELAAAVRQSTPLFHGSLPEAGNLGDAVEAALQSLLTAKGIASAKVTHEIVEPSTSDPVRNVTFSLASPEVRIHAVHLSGASPEMRPATDKIAAGLANHPYNEAALTHALLEPWQNAGYLGASLTGVTRTPAAGAGHIEVDFIATIQPGDPYRVTALSFAGTPLLSAADFAKASTLHSGDPASQKTLLESLTPIEDAYRAQGYMDVVVNAVPTTDAAAHTVAYTISVTPGAQYRLRTVTPTGLTPQQLAAFQSRWKLNAGELYNPLYVRDFLKSNAAVVSLGNISATFKAVADPDSHLVDLTIKFVKMQ